MDISKWDVLITDSAATAWPPSNRSAECKTVLNASSVGNPCALEGNSACWSPGLADERFDW